jgi:Tetratricopeptide Repeats-Sensor
VRAFVVRPFGTKQGIDFNRMQRELITPVLQAAKITGATTEAIARAGNIRTDMFEQLLLADVVIADISIHNANVYYELGVRHSLRPRTTILIRARRDEVPFDLRTDRYLEYDPENPSEAQANLTEAVRQSLASKAPDSPVFLLLPALEPTDVANFRPIPAEFSEAVSSARRAEDLPMLAVLADEAAEFEWGLAALRLIARAQLALRGWPDARATCEAIRSRRPEDPEANLLLATIYDRLGDPVASMAALERVTAAGALTTAQQAEALALKGRNVKNLWIADWRNVPPERRQAAALRSAQLESARVAYDEAFLLDQNHWYSGINALALLSVTTALAASQPGVFAERFDDEDEAAAELRRLERERVELSAAVRRSLSAEAFRSRGQPYDVWADLTRADLLLLSSDNPGRVAAAYERARARMAAEGGGGFPADSAAQQIRLYLALGLFTDTARAALAALGVSEDPPAPMPRSRVMVFSGHRLDAPGREPPRFPATPESIARATQMIRDAVQTEKELAGDGPIEGIAGGASGGDILFHEICLELGIPTTLMLAIPRDDYAAASVADAGPEWVERFRALVERLDVKLLSQTKELPSWLAERGDYSIWQRNNRWTLHTGLSRSDVDASLIVLWDGKGGDGPGGTEDMVKAASSRGVRIVQLPAEKLTAP